MLEQFSKFKIKNTQVIYGGNRGTNIANSEKSHNEDDQPA